MCQLSNSFIHETSTVAADVPIYNPSDYPHIPAAYPLYWHSCLGMVGTFSFCKSLIVHTFRGLQEQSHYQRKDGFSNYTWRRHLFNCTCISIVCQCSELHLPSYLVHFSSVHEADDSAFFLQPIHPTFRNSELNLQNGTFVLSFISDHWTSCKWESPQERQD